MKANLYFNKKFRSEMYGIETDPKPFDEVSDAELDAYWMNLAQPSRELGVMAAISNCGAAYRSKGVRALSELLKYPNGTKALDVFGRCHGKLQDKFDSETYVKLQKEEMKPGYFSLPKVIRHYNSLVFIYRNSSRKK